MAISDAKIGPCISSKLLDHRLYVSLGLTVTLIGLLRVNFCFKVCANFLRLCNYTRLQFAILCGSLLILRLFSLIFNIRRVRATFKDVLHPLLRQRNLLFGSHILKTVYYLYKDFWLA